MDVLLMAAALPVIALCYYIYSKDQHREPVKLLYKLLGFGALITIPVIATELVLNKFCDTDKVLSFLSIFIKVFIGVALAEEGFKWLIVKVKAYNNQEFDEIYDIIVYSVFVSLGFALVENILYVFKYGFGTAIVRALLAVPGHACFGVLMGFYLSKAKVASLNNNKAMTVRNTAFSLLVPMLFHTIYDSLLIWAENIKLAIQESIIKGLTIPTLPKASTITWSFLLFDIIMVVLCFIIVNKTSKVQQNLSENLEAGSIVNNDGKIKLVETQAAPTSINFCPLCGTNVTNSNYCPKCGLRIR